MLLYPSKRGLTMQNHKEGCLGVAAHLLPLYLTVTSLP